MTTVFLTAGTRGDVQPVAALARGLVAAGKPVRVAAPASFGNWFESLGIPFAPIQGNPTDLMLEPGGQSALTFDGNPLRNLQVSLRYVKRAQPVYTQMLESGLEACRGASRLVIGLPTLWGAHLAEGMQIPCHGAFLQPVTPAGDFPAPLLPFTFSLGKTYNRLTYRLASQITWLPWRSTINEWRFKHGLKRHSFFDFTKKLGRVFYGFSPRVVPRPADWSYDARAVGYWTLPSRPGPAALQQFIEAGPAPVYVGFGSGGVRQPDEMVELVLTALEAAGTRAVFSLPDGASMRHLPASVFPLNEPVDHHWLFPQMSGLVHHCGAGTTAAGLIAGVPTQSCPQTMDQFFWAGRIHALEVGPRPLPQRALTKNQLIDGLLALKNEAMRTKAQALGQKLRSEDGIDGFLRFQVGRE